MPQSQSTRTRKISLQNDYAYCIISPVSPSVVLVQNSYISTKSPSSGHPNNMHNANNILDPDLMQNVDRIEEAEEAYLSLETNSSPRGFRRWSFCNFQTSGIPVSAAVSEATALDFGNQNDGYGFKLMGNNSRKSSAETSNSSSSTSLSKMSELISNFPDRIRKISSGSGKFDVQSSQMDEDIRGQMKKLLVY